MTIIVATPDPNGLPFFDRDGNVVTTTAPDGTPIKMVNGFNMVFTPDDTANRAADAQAAADRNNRSKADRIDEDILDGAGFTTDPLMRAVIDEIISRLVPPVTPTAFEAAVKVRLEADPELD